MNRRVVGYLVDTGLLILLVVGNEDRALIPRFRRLSGYTDQDYDILHNLIRRAGQVLVTPNTLTEVSNLIG